MGSFAGQIAPGEVPPVHSLLVPASPSHPGQDTQGEQDQLSHTSGMPVQVGCNARAWDCSCRGLEVTAGESQGGLGTGSGTFLGAPPIATH